MSGDGRRHRQDEASRAARAGASNVPAPQSSDTGGGTAAEGAPACLRCGFPVEPKPLGCKNPCPNCGFTYPLGDCSD
jgi:hypothetical protein